MQKNIFNEILINSVYRTVYYLSMYILMILMIVMKKYHGRKNQQTISRKVLPQIQEVF